MKEPRERNGTLSLSVLEIHSREAGIVGLSVYVELRSTRIRTYDF